MDKNANRPEEEVKVEQDLRFINIHVHQKRLAMLNDFLKSMEHQKDEGENLLWKYSKSIRISNKKFIPYFSILMNITYEAMKYSLIASCAVELLQEKTEILEGMIGKITEKTRDLPASEDLKKLQKVSEQIAHIDAIMTTIQNQKYTNKPEEKPSKKGNPLVR